MPVTYFFTKSAAELLALLTIAENDYAAGSALIAAGSGDVNSQRIVQNNALQRILTLQQALYQKDSTTYAQFKNVNSKKAVGSI